MSLWALSGNMIGQAFSDGFNQGFNTADDEMKKRRELQFNLDLERQMKEEEARKLGALFDAVTGKTEFENNRIVPQVDIFKQPQNSTPIPLQEGQASPNNNNIGITSLFQGANASTPALTQETLDAGVMNYNNAFNSWKSDKPYTNEQWALANALNDGNYSAIALMNNELNKIFNPAKPVTTYRDYFDENKKAYMRQEVVNGQPVGDPYMIKPYESQLDLMKWKYQYNKGSGSGSNKNRETYKVIDGIEHRVVIDNQGNIVKDLGVTENGLKNFRTEQIKNGKDPAVVELAEQALWTTGDKAYAIDVLNGRYNTGRIIKSSIPFINNNIDLAEELEHYNVEAGNHTKGNREIANLLNDYADQIVRDLIKYGEEVLNLVPKEMRDNEKFIQMVMARLKDNDSNNDTAVAKNNPQESKKEIKNVVFKQ